MGTVKVTAKIAFQSNADHFWTGYIGIFFAPVTLALTW